MERIEQAVGKRVGSGIARRAFAQNLLLALRDVIPAGEQAQIRRKVAKRLEKAARLSGDALATLIGEMSAPNLLSMKLEHEAVHAAKMLHGTQLGPNPPWNPPGLPDPEWGPNYSRLLFFFDTLKRRAAKELAKAPPARRGPQNILAASIAECIALEYHHSFGQYPGKGKRASDKKDTPFHRVCAVVEALLADLGYTLISKGSHHPITLSDTARAEGIARARNGGASFVRTQLIRLQRSE